MLADPEQGDYRTAPEAAAYGCQTFLEPGFNTPSAPIVPVLSLETSGSRSRSSIEVSGLIDNDTIWDADTVLVTGEVEVADAVTLTIPAGTLVEFQGFYNLQILGRLLAVGTNDDWIHFTSNEPELFQPDSTTDGSWNGIRFPGTLATNLDSRLEFCLIEYSKELAGEEIGGALSVSNFSRLQVTNCILRQNMARWGGAIGCTFNAAPRISNCVISDNYALSGGSVLYSSYSYPRLTGNTIVHNEVLNQEIFDATATVHSYMGKPQQTANILYFNICHFFEPIELWGMKDYYTAWNDLTYGHGGQGNFDIDPLFSNDNEHPYSLRAESPCIDAFTGDTSGFSFPFWDILGNDRFWDGDEDGLARLDVGAYEFGAPPCEGDCPVPPPVPNDIQLLQNYPNPFNPSTTIEFALASPGEIRLEVFNLLGQRVALLAEGVFAAGIHRVTFDAFAGAGESRHLSSGMYIYRLTTDHDLLARKMILIR
jgi:hypothetical protein